MKKRRILLLSSVFAILSLQLYAQKDSEKVTPYQSSTKLTNPAPSNLEPVAIDLSEAKEEGSSNMKLAGFSDVFFSGDEITKLLSDKNAVGIRFYNAFESKLNTVTLVAVAVKSDGSEIKGGEKKYLISMINKASVLHWRGYARTCVLQCTDMKELKHFTAFFDKSTLTTLLADSANGFKLIPASRKFEMEDKSVKTYNTMMVIGATNEGGAISEVGSTYFKSLYPCPHHCPIDDTKLLVPLSDY